MSTNGSTPTVPGDRIAGRYRIDAVIGTGGMATVYRATDEELGRTVALKIFRTDVVDAASMRRQAEEIRLLASLDHPALVTLYDVVPAIADDPASGGVLVMQYIEGQDLRGRLAAEGPLPGATAAAIGADVAAALAYVHSAGVVHRDVSPANVLLPTVHTGGAPIARLADFGIARLVDSAGLTGTGTVIGTATYLSPEQARGEQLTPASDIYSLGLVLLESLTGERAFPGTAVESAMARLATDPSIPDDLNPAWRELLAAMTAREPADRPDAAALVTRLQTLPTSRAATKLLPVPVLGTGAATELLPAGDSPTRVLPTADAATQVLASAPADSATQVLPSAQPTGTERISSTPPAKRASRPNRAVVVLAILAAALLVVVAIFALSGLNSTGSPEEAAPVETPTAETPVEETPVAETPVEEEPAAPDYPVVEGPLGDALRALQESVADPSISDSWRDAVLAISNSAAAGDYETALDDLDDFLNDFDNDEAISDQQSETTNSAGDRLERELEAAKKQAEKDDGPGNGNGNGPGNEG